jgi:NAD+ synthase
MDRIKDYKEVENHIVGWMKNYLTNSHLQGWVIGISGGIDSAVVSTLAAKTEAPVILLEIPIKQGNSEVSRAKKHIEWLKSNYSNVKSFEIDLEFSVPAVMLADEVREAYIKINLFSQFITQLNNAFNINGETETTNLAEANSRSRLRMTMLYYVAAFNKSLVLGTGNKVEDFGVGFFTKYGDGGVDISPIADLYKTEVRQLGKHMGVSEEIVTATPTDGLWDDGRTDESQLGASYEELEWAMEYIENNPRHFSYSPGDLKLLSTRQREVLLIYKTRHFANAHKMAVPPICKINICIV